MIGNLQAFIRRRVLGRGDRAWPFIAGKYTVVDPTAPVIVVMANDDKLAADIVALADRGLCMVAPQCRSVAHAEKLVRNVAANLAVHFVVVVGDSDGERGVLDALLATLSGRENGSDTAALRGRLESVDLAALRKQIKPVDMRGCAEVERIIGKINELASEANRPNTGFRAEARDGAPDVERVIAATNIAYEMQPDKAGSYLIRIDKDQLVVEHVNSKRDLLRVIEGKTARDLCITLIRNGWVSKLDHAAYLGRELARAEDAMRSGEPYVQDLDGLLRPDSGGGETQH